MGGGAKRMRSAVACLAFLALSHAALQGLPFYNGTAYRACDAASEQLAALRRELDTPFQEHVYTRRGFSSLAEVMPEFFSLPMFLGTAAAGAAKFHLLEQGCGSGRFLLETKQAFPALQLYGVNYRGYTGYGQVDGSLPQLLSAADHFNVTVMCSDGGAPVFPEVRLTESITASDFAYAHFFPSVKFDLIVSRDALNAMKLDAGESHVYIPKMLHALKPGGLAVVQTDYAANYIYHDMPGFAAKPFTIVGEWETRFDGARVSMLMYKKHEDGQHLDKRRSESFYYSFFGLVIRKCLPSDTPGTGCILPHDYVNRYPGDLQLWKAPFSDWKPARKEAIPHRVQYAFDYHENLVQFLRKWEREGVVHSGD